MAMFDDIFDSLQDAPYVTMNVALTWLIYITDSDLLSVRMWKRHSLNELTELAQFLMQYIEQVESLLQFISACRSVYQAALENEIKYFFARNLFNHARLMTLYLAEMND